MVAEEGGERETYEVPPCEKVQLAVGLLPDRTQPVSCRIRGP